MITIVIGKSDIGQAGEPRTFDPRLQKSLGIVLCPVSLRMGVVIREQRRWSIGVPECWSVVHHHVITPSLHLLRRRHEFLPYAQLWVHREENFGYKDFVGAELACRDCFVILDVLSRIDQDNARLVSNRVVVRPLGQHDLRGIH